MGCGSSRAAGTTLAVTEPAALPSKLIEPFARESASRESAPSSRPSSPLLITEPSRAATEKTSQPEDNAPAAPAPAAAPAAPAAAPAAPAPAAAEQTPPRVIRTNRNGFRMQVMQDSTNRVAAAPGATAQKASAAAAAPAAPQPPSRELVDRTLLAHCFLVRCDWQSVGALACVCKGWAKALFGKQQAEVTWEAICQSIGAAQGLYVPPQYSKSWKTLFFDMLFSARAMWKPPPVLDEAGESALAATAASQSYQIQVFARFRPGDSGDDTDKLFLPLRQRLKLKHKGDKIASESFGLPVKTVRELLESGVLKTGTDLPPEIFAALAEAASLDTAADSAIREAIKRPGEKDPEDTEAEAAEAAARMVVQASEDEAAAVAAASAASTADDEDGSEKQEDQPFASKRPHVAVQRRHGNARLLTVKPAQAVMFIPGQGFRPFQFHSCFDQSSQQAQVYEQSARDAVCSVLNGYNASLLCYGQTGSGKTHTIFGPDKLLQAMMEDQDATSQSLMENKDAGVVRFLPSVSVSFCRSSFKTLVLWTQSLFWHCRCCGQSPS